MEESNVITIPKHDSLLETIRERPAMYLGENSLTALEYYVRGFEEGLFHAGIRRPSEIPRSFSDWVGYRLRLGSNCSGFWRRAILSRVRNESAALSRFYELHDEYLQRRAKLVATIRKDCRGYKTGQSNEKRQIIWNIEMLPVSLSIVVYTEDPGFFLIADESESYFFNEWFFASLDSMIHKPISGLDSFEIKDQVTWDRLLAESKKYKRKLARTRARIQKKSGADINKFA